MKKAVFITYNQALTERVAFLLDQLQIKGLHNGLWLTEQEQKPENLVWDLIPGRK